MKMLKILPIAASAFLATAVANASFAKVVHNIQGSYESKDKLQSLLVKADGPDTYNVTFSERHPAVLHCGGSSFSCGAPHLALDPNGHDLKLDTDEWKRYTIHFKNGTANITYEDFSIGAGKAGRPQFTENFHLRKVSSAVEQSDDLPQN